MSRDPGLVISPTLCSRMFGLLGVLRDMLEEFLVMLAWFGELCPLELQMEFRSSLIRDLLLLDCLSFETGLSPENAGELAVLGIGEQDADRSGQSRVEYAREGVEVVECQDDRENWRGDHREQLPVVDEGYIVEDGDRYGVKPCQLEEVGVLELVELPAGVDVAHYGGQVSVAVLPVLVYQGLSVVIAVQGQLDGDQEGQHETDQLNSEQQTVAFEGLLRAVTELGDLQLPNLGDL
ncbi:hypothetical protein OJ253_2148 [Cryptosporidium canis]|uniref:Uncharacterized protein n=1 Tax=Cryptosporidium canis TaxID=195482 RepID=A0A9D5DFU9_9CRYT|nr:hypothetical protein OJ253_2148 [Cryptosporidium canis]